MKLLDHYEDGVGNKIGRNVLDNGRSTEAEGENVSGQLVQVQMMCQERSIYDES